MIRNITSEVHYMSEISRLDRKDGQDHERTKFVGDFTDKVVQTTVETAKAVEKTIKRTVYWDNIATWQQDNQWIHTGYREASNSCWGSASSLGYLHNESVNIYSHLIGSLAFAIGGAGLLLWPPFKARYPEASREEVYVFACFFLGAVICLGMSATYHTISNHSEHVAKVGNKLDYLGIVFLIWGSFIPSVYYGFSCDTQLITRYWTMVSRSIISLQYQKPNVAC